MMVIHSTASKPIPVIPGEDPGPGILRDTALSPASPHPQPSSSGLTRGPSQPVHPRRASAPLRELRPCRP
ncbi:hypothetical protein SAMN04487974_106173 [Pelagibacterium luteolum]|uniref:Uncharacterized protein n=1 Tax=Pelagibacterium luteolum TaxID=440168 RepID=A0A1G7WHU1_9HYPH|nr:hypothetical protein SAMN04487974_106173 [Pelagibacterium luteolum]